MTSKHHHKRTRWPPILVIGGIVLLITGMLVYKNIAAGTSQAGSLPEEEFHRALAAGKPTVVFFHSVTCDPCIEMMNTVGEVYPEFASSVTLIDVNVSERPFENSCWVEWRCQPNHSHQNRNEVRVP